MEANGTTQGKTNGTAAPSRGYDRDIPTAKAVRKARRAEAQLREARAALELRKIRCQEQILSQQQRLIGFNESRAGQRATGHGGAGTAALNESVDYDGAGFSAQWGQFVDPRGSFPDGGAMGRYPFTTISLPSDRQHGRQWPLWLNIQELGYFRQASRVLCATNTQAKGVLKNLTNYLIGTGFKYNAVAKDDVKDAGADNVVQAVKQVQDCIDAFLGEADPTTRMTPWNWRERESFRRTRRDGECFLRLFPRKNTGKLDVRFIEPEQVRDSPGATFADGWSYGIQHYVDHGQDDGSGAIEDVETIVAYHVVYKANAAKGEIVPASEIVHIKNVDEDSTVKRGLPDFIYDTLASFARAGKLQRNLSEGAALQACIAWIEEFESATSGQVQAYVDGRSVDNLTDPMTGNNTTIEKVVPGTISRIPRSKKFLHPPWNEGAANQQAIVQGDLRQGLSAFCAPEYFSSDASNADYSSTKEAGAPFVKCGETDQAYFRCHFLRIVWRAVRWAVECGTLPKEVLDLVTIQVEAPVILHKDPLIQAQTDQILVTACGKSRQTVLMEQGLDPDIEEANNAEWAEHNPMPAQGIGDLLPATAGDFGPAAPTGGS